MMHVEALQWLHCIFARRLRADCHQLYDLGNAKNVDALPMCCAFSGPPSDATARQGAPSGKLEEPQRKKTTVLSCDIHTHTPPCPKEFCKLPAVLFL